MAKKQVGLTDQQQKDIDETARTRKWKSEIELAGKREKDWREKAEKILNRYRGKERKKNSFNILWANTEILRPALYSSKPTPDVRRRFRDSDPVGKAVAEVIERSLSVVIDYAETDSSFRRDVFDSLVPGRGLSRVVYEPKIATEVADSDADDKPEEEPEVFERLEYEKVCIQHVDWQDFRMGYGRVWEEVPWVSFRHKLTEDEAEKKFGEDAISEVKFTPPVVEDEKKQEDSTNTVKIAEFWEVWDKTTQRVFFTQDQCEKRLYPLDNPEGEPPLKLDGFFPCASPILIIEDTGSLVPIPIYTLYEQQAVELDLISRRINDIVNKTRLRGAYDSSLPEMADIMASEDGDLVPVSKVAAWMSNGGLDKAITWMPIAPSAQVLEVLNKAREAAKSVIYEITGISDIVRGASVASETATAQQIKANYASQRLQRMQREVQRYIRDTLRLCAEVIADKFGQDTLQKMTNLQFPTAEQKAQVQMQLQQQAQMAQQTGQPPPPPPDDIQMMLKLPTWEDIIGLLRNDALRAYRVDIETDSTIADTMASDMKGLGDLIQAIGGAMQVFAPLVMQKALPLEAAKGIIQSITRRARMGNAIEDELDKMQVPQPMPPPPDHSMEVAQLKSQADAQMAQAEAANEAKMTQMQQQFEAQKMQQEQAFKAQLDQVQKQHEQQMAQMQSQSENLRTATQLETQRMIADANNATNLRIAELTKAHEAAMQTQQQAHDAAMQSQQLQAKKESDALMAAAKPANTDSAPETEEPKAADYKQAESDNGMQESMKTLIPLMTQVAFHLSKPKKVVRDENGKIMGVE